MRKLQGLTTFEVIIAIIVFGTGILVILSMITKNVGWLRDIKQRDTATMLAKEGIEIIYNLRDTNIDKGVVWSCAEYSVSVSDNCANYFHDQNTGLSIFEVNWDLTGTYYLTEVGTTGDSWIYFHSGTLLATGGSALWSGFWYNHYPTGGQLTEFRRNIIFRPVANYADSTGNILIVESHVYYESGPLLRSVVLESMIGKTR